MDEDIRLTLQQLENDAPDPDDEDEWIERRIRAAKALGESRSTAAFEPLVRTLMRSLKKDDELSLGWYVIEALGELGDARGINVIQPLEHHRDIDVRKAVKKALGLLNK